VRSTLAIVLIAALCTGCAPEFDLASLVGSTWLAEDIDGKDVMDSPQSTLKLVGPTQVAGHAGCNSFAGKATMSGNRLQLGPFASTRMMCTPAVMDQEGGFLKALEMARSARMERGELYLMDETGAQVLRLSRLDS
jgi:heat shock protein HslJ